MKYIGVRGHRGAGKTSVAWLLGNMIEVLLSCPSQTEDEKLRTSFDMWCEQIKENPLIIEQIGLQRVMFEEFGDTPKMFVSLLTGIPLDKMNDDCLKDSIIINLKNFEQVEYTEEIEDHLWTAERFFDQNEPGYCPQPIRTDIYMSLREFILYFGIYVMQNAFGLNVWVKTIVANSSLFEFHVPGDENDYKIYSDIKSSAEIDYIKDKEGIIIKVVRPKHRKTGGMNMLRGDSRADYTITVDGDLNELYDQIYNIVTKITSRHESI